MPVVILVLVKIGIRGHRGVHHLGKSDEVRVLVGAILRPEIEEVAVVFLVGAVAIASRARRRVKHSSVGVPDPVPIVVDDEPIVHFEEVSVPITVEPEADEVRVRHPIVLPGRDDAVVHLPAHQGKAFRVRDRRASLALAQEIVRYPGPCVGAVPLVVLQVELSNAAVEKVVARQDHPEAAVPAGARPRAACEVRLGLVINGAPSKDERSIDRIIGEENPVGEQIFVVLRHPEAVVLKQGGRVFDIVAIDAVALVVERC